MHFGLLLRRSLTPTSFIDLIVDPATGTPKSLLLLSQVSVTGAPIKFTISVYETKPVGAIYKQTYQPPCPLFPGYSNTVPGITGARRRTLSTTTADPPSSAVHQFIPDWVGADAYFNSVTNGYIASNFTAVNLTHYITEYDLPGPISANAASYYDLSVNASVSCLVKNQARCAAW